VLLKPSIHRNALVLRHKSDMPYMDKREILLEAVE